MADAAALELRGVIGFGGGVREGLVLDAASAALVYPLGSTIVLATLAGDGPQEFLRGHGDDVSCLAISPSGRFLATGQVTHMGFAADVIVWDLRSRSLLHRLALHKVRVQSLSFSCDERYLASLGGQDDKSLVVWEVESGTPVCGSPTSRELTTSVKFLNNDPHRLVTAGKDNLATWDFDPQNRKLKMRECKMGQCVRECKSVALSADDEYAYFGSVSGDVLKVSLRTALFKAAGPRRPFSKGVECTALAPTGELLVGTGDGVVALMDPTTLSVRCQCKLNKASEERVTSMVPLSMSGDDAFTFLVGTSKCAVYVVSYTAAAGLGAELLQTCHFARVNDAAFPAGFSEVFATCAGEEVRVWHARELRELLRVRVAGAECLCVTFMPDGGSILSGWSDGKIRAYGPQTGKLLYEVHDAHSGGVTALATTSDCARVLSGGGEGLVRVWRIGPQSRSMVASMREHKARVTSIVVRPSGSEFASASSDGSCIVWDMGRLRRNTSLLASTNFTEIAYHPDESQLLTTGADRKVTYWDAFDGQAIRIVDGSEEAAVNALAVSADGESFVCAGSDRLVKLYGYDEGVPKAVGEGHSGAVQRVRISPDQQTIVSVGAEGGVFLWANKAA